MNSGNATTPIPEEEKTTPANPKNIYDYLWQHGASVLQTLMLENRSLNLTVLGQENFYSKQFAEQNKNHAAEISELTAEVNEARAKANQLAKQLELSQSLLNRSLHELQLARDDIESLKTINRRELRRLSEIRRHEKWQSTPPLMGRNMLLPAPKPTDNPGGELTTSTYYLRNNLTRRRTK